MGFSTTRPMMLNPPILLNPIVTAAAAFQSSDIPVRVQEYQVAYSVFYGVVQGIRNQGFDSDLTAI